MQTMSGDGAMGVDELLLALSAKKEGSWHQFKEIAARVAVSVVSRSGNSDEDADTEPQFSQFQEIRFNLERLCHVEFFANGCNNGWRVAPPVMAIDKRDGGYEAILAGARTERMIYGLLESSIADAVKIESQEMCPNRITINWTDLTELERLGRDLGFIVKKEVPETILSSLTKLPCIAGDECLPPFGDDWKIERLDVKLRRWSAPGDVTANVELLRYTGAYERFLLIKHGTRHIRVIDSAQAKFQILEEERESVFEYDPECLTLSVPRIFRPPGLVERAMILYSGRLPEYVWNDRKLVYSQITEKVATTVRYLLKQEAVK